MTTILHLNIHQPEGEVILLIESEPALIVVINQQQTNLKQMQQ